MGYIGLLLGAILYVYFTLGGGSERNILGSPSTAADIRAMVFLGCVVMIIIYWTINLFKS